MRRKPAMQNPIRSHSCAVQEGNTVSTTELDGYGDEMHDFSYVRLLKSCAETKDIKRGVRLHDDIVKKKLLERSSYVASSLINMYAKCGFLGEAQELLESIQFRNVVSWSTVISGYVRQGHGHKALDCFERMQREGIFPDAIAFTCILKACGIIGDIDKGKEVHHEIITMGLVLEEDIVLSNALVDMYVKCGHLPDAQRVHDQLRARDIVSWNALIAGYAQQEQGHEALVSFRLMRREGYCPDVVTLTCILKGCGSIEDTTKGKELHCEIVDRGLLSENTLLGNSLVDMYAKCGEFEIAKKVHEELPFRDIISWNALISGYTDWGHSREALNCFEQLQCEGQNPDVVTFTCILKACGSMRAIQEGKEVHNVISQRGLLEKDSMLGISLVDMYAKCGLLEKAQQVHDGLPFRDANSWKALTSGYVHKQRNSELLKCYDMILSEGLFPDVVTLVSILKGCGNIQDLEKGKQIHDEIVNRGLLKRNVVIGNALMDMYAKCGHLEKAQEVFYKLPEHNLVSWNALIAGYTQQGQGKEALDLFESMKSEGYSPDAVTFTCILKSCGSIGALDKGKHIHDEIIHMKFLENDVVLATALVDMYAKCGVLTKAQEVLHDIPFRNEISWFALISGYNQYQQGYEVLKCFKQMQIEGFFPDTDTLVCILKGCAIVAAVDKGEQVHAGIISGCMLEQNIVLGSVVVDMYAKCGMLKRAYHVHDDLPIRDIVTWNTLISGYSQQEQGRDALNCFEQMTVEGLSPDVVTLVCILNSCGSVGALEKGEQIHEMIVTGGLIGKSIAIGNALVDMYAKCGVLGKALQVHVDLPIWDTISWNSLIAGYAQQGQGYKALNCFQWMQTEGMSPNAITFLCLLKACGSIGAIDEGKQIHSDIVSKELLEANDVLGNALVDMYAKCGFLRKAQELHDHLVVRSLVSWNTLISGYAQQGHGHEALNCFEQMKNEGLVPNGITFLCVMSACNHSGLLKETQTYYENMSKMYNIIPNVEHHACMVSAFGSGGHFDEAMMVMKNTSPSFNHYPPVWLALLSACNKWGNEKVARSVFNQFGEHMMK